MDVVETWVTLPESAVIIDELSVRRLRDLVKRGEIPSRKVAGIRLLRVDDVRAFAARRTIDPPAIGRPRTRTRG